MMIGWLIDKLDGIYDWLYGLVYWFIRGLAYMVSDPEAFFKEYGLVILLLTGLGITIILIINWVSKRYLLNRVYLVHPDKPNDRRYIGRKVLPFIHKDNPITEYIFRSKIEKDRWDEFDGVVYFVYTKTVFKIPISFKSNKIMIPSKDRKTWEMKGGVRWKRDFLIYFTGMKEAEGLRALRASMKSKSTTEAIGPEFFEKVGKEKIDTADDFAQKGVTANAESQQYQQALGSIPHSQGYNELSDREIASVYLEEEEGEEVEPEEIPQKEVDTIMKELEVGENA